MTPLHDIAETAAALGQDDLAAQIREWAGEVERLREANRWLDTARTVLIPELRAANDGLRSELEAAKKDAGRYRWLRDGELGPVAHNDDFPMAITSSTRRHLWREDLDAAIDAEMAKDATHAAYMAASADLGQEF